MLYETAARANEVLALNVEDRYRARKRAAVVGKGGRREMICWASGTARLLARYLRGRRRGPVFVTLHHPPTSYPLPATDAPTPAEGASPTKEYAQRSGKPVAGGPSTNSATPPSPT